MKLLFFAIATLFTISQAVTCSNPAQCMSSSVSTNPNWVDCIEGECVCAWLRGAKGDATVSNPCFCPSDREVKAEKGKVLCSGSIQKYVEESARCERQIEVVEEIYNLINYPKCQGVITGATDVSKLFSPDTVLRVTPLGYYPTLEGAKEYYFGIACSLASLINRTMARSITCTGNTTSGRFDLLANFENNPLPGFANFPVFNFTHFFNIIHDDQGRARYMDVVFPNLGYTSDFGPDDTFFNPFTNSTMNKRQVFIYNGCQTVMTNCIGANQQYGGDMNVCLGVMFSKPFGSWDRANSDTALCRSFHALLTPVDPNMHCPHAGPTGGGKCVTFSQQSYYATDPVEPGYFYNKVVGVAEV